MENQETENKSLVISKIAQKNFWTVTKVDNGVQAFSCNSISIAKIKKYTSDIAVSAFLTIGVIDLIEGFNIGKTMNENQVNFMVETIKQDYYYLKPEELKYCFDNAKKGRYGQLYDRLDAAIICEWIEKYLEERTQIAINLRENENKINNSGSIHPKYASKLKELFKEENINPVIPQEKREKTEHEILVQDILREFDSLYSNAPTISEAFRTIEYLGKRITVEQFLEIRLSELSKI